MENTSLEGGNENIIIYATHVILYANDTACYSIRQLKPYIETMDKETKKIYGALRKRVKSYLDSLYKITGDSSYFLADFCEYMDEEVDKNIEGFTRSIGWVYRCNGIEEYEFLAKLETARAMTEFAVATIDEVLGTFPKYGIPKKRLPTYRLSEQYRIINNLSDWVMKVIKNKKCINLNEKKSVMKYFEKIKTSLLSYKNIEDAFKHAVEESKNARKDLENN